MGGAPDLEGADWLEVFEFEMDVAEREKGGPDGRLVYDGARRLNVFS